MEHYIVFLGDESNDIYISKTAHCLLRYIPKQIVGIMHMDKKIKQIGDLFPEYCSFNIPIFHTTHEVEKLDKATKIVIGFAPIGGKLSEDNESILLELMDKGYKVVNMLHTTLNHKNAINYRNTNYERKVATGKISHTGTRILFVGTDFSIGKMTCTLSMYNYMKNKDYNVEWIATGQTGKLLHDGQGVVLDTLIVDFLPGNIELQINESKADYLLIEGQGSIFHPSYSPTSFALFHASKPDYLVICDNPTKKRGHLGNILPSLQETKIFYEDLAKKLGFSTQVIGVALNTRELNEEQYFKVKEELEKTLNIPCCDVVKENPAGLVEQLEKVKGNYIVEEEKNDFEFK